MSLVYSLNEVSKTIGSDQVDASNENQFYIVGNGGTENTISAPMESYLPEIKVWVISQIDSGELFKDEKKSLLLDRNILVHYLSIVPYAKE